MSESSVPEGRVAGETKSGDHDGNGGGGKQGLTHPQQQATHRPRPSNRHLHGLKTSQPWNEAPNGYKFSNWIRI